MNSSQAFFPEGSHLANAILFSFSRLSVTSCISLPRTRFHLTGYSTDFCCGVVCPLSVNVDDLSLSINISPGVWLDKRVEKIIQMMRDDVRGELSLAEFAQSVNLSVWRLCHIFKSDVGMPPIRYLRLMRMERAKGLLESSFLSVKEIAFRVGLNDESHFVRDFKSTYGFSPALYRSHYKSNSNTNGKGNGNGHSEVKEGQNGNQSNTLAQQLAQAAKQSILPSLHLIVYMFSYLN